MSLILLLWIISQIFNLILKLENICVLWNNLTVNKNKFISSKKNILIKYFKSNQYVSFLCVQIQKILELWHYIDLRKNSIFSFIKNFDFNNNFRKNKSAIFAILLLITFFKITLINNLNKLTNLSVALPLQKGRLNVEQ